MIQVGQIYTEKDWGQSTHVRCQYVVLSSDERDVWKLVEFQICHTRLGKYLGTKEIVELYKHEMEERLKLVGMI